MGYSVGEPTPNESPGEVHPMAVAQLELYQRIAESWPRYPDGRCVRCGKCDQSIYMRWDSQGQRYQYLYSQILSLVVAHIRQNHEKVIENGID